MSADARSRLNIDGDEDVTKGTFCPSTQTGQNLPAAPTASPRARAALLVINRRANKQPAHPTGSQGASQVAWHVAPRRGSDTAGGAGGRAAARSEAEGTQTKT